jgi:hypothetical protein
MMVFLQRKRLRFKILIIYILFTEKFTTHNSLEHEIP